MNYLLYYNTNTGTGAIGRIDEVGNHITLKSYPGASFLTSWTHIATTENHFLYYNANTGAGAIGQIDTLGNLSTLKSYPEGSFSTGWTHITATSEHFLTYNINTGAGGTGRIDESGNFITLKSYPAGSFSTWTHIATTKNHFLYYNTNTGIGAVGQIDVLGNLITLKSYPERSFSTGWTHITATSEHFLTYNINTGAGGTGRIDESGNFITLKGYPEASFSTGWTHITATSEHFLTYNINTGASAISQINADGDFITLKSYPDGASSRGWTHITASKPLQAQKRMSVAFRPAVLDLQAVAPETVKTTSVIAIAPSAAKVTVTILDDPTHFRITAVESYDIVRRRLTPEELQDLPRDMRERARKVLVEDLVPINSSDGVVPLAVEAGQKVIITVEYAAKNLTAQDEYSARLLITTDTWKPVAIPITMLVAHVETTLPTAQITLLQGDSPVPVPFTVQSVSGPDTTVLYTIMDDPHWRMQPVSVFVPRGQTVQGTFMLQATWKAPQGTWKPDIVQLAFNGKKMRWLPITLTILPGRASVAVEQPHLVVKQGDTVECLLQVILGGEATDVTLTPDGVLPRGIFAVTRTVRASGGRTSQPVKFVFQTDGNAELGVNMPIKLNWSAYGGERAGSVDVQLTVLPGLGRPTRRFEPSKHAFRFGNRWSFTRQDGEALRALIARELAVVAALPLRRVRGSLDAINLSLPWPLPDVGLPGFIIESVISVASGHVVGWLHDLAIGAIPGENYGRCGGMAFAAYDFFLLGWSVDHFGDQVPNSGDLRDYIWRRLLDSLDLNIGKFLEWIVILHVLPRLDDIATAALLASIGSVWGPIGAAIGALIGSQINFFHWGGARELRDKTSHEMQKLKERLEREAAWPIGLIYGNSANPIDQHQVLAIGYQDHGNGTATLQIWDNNHRDSSDILTLDFRGEELVVVTAPRIYAPIKGIFCEEYSSVRPPVSLRHV
ncbi:hypothetical protein H6F89_29140 [Cyanobacteria bacterium FACHB-63]|nr:hypothetical protein [Cyanobacteria bacterium FACHB-63]